MTEQRYIVIPNWDGSDGFQHYRDRRPIWIKNYVELLSKPEYATLSFADRGLLHGLWLLYAESTQNIVVNTLYLARQLGGRVTKKSLQRLNDAGFIEFSASRPLAGCYQVASPERETERETERQDQEQKQKPPTATAVVRPPARDPRGGASQPHAESTPRPETPDPDPTTTTSANGHTTRQPTAPDIPLDPEHAAHVRHLITTSLTQTRQRQGQ